MPYTREFKTIIDLLGDIANRLDILIGLCVVILAISLAAALVAIIRNRRIS